MESSARLDDSRAKALRGLFSADMLWVAWLPVVVIGAFHYTAGTQAHWAHDVLRRLYYVPILFAAFSRGWRGGLAVAAFSSLTYAPHAFLVLPTAPDPGTTLNKLLEIFLYNTIGLLAGVLADREANRRRQAERAYAEQRRMAEQLVRAGRLAALGQLVAGIAHEIKNPLHTLKGTAEIVDEIIPEDAEQAPMWRLLRQEIDRLEHVAERFLSFARPSTPDLRRQELAAVYDRISELLAAQVHGQPEVRLEIAPLSPELAGLQLHADRDQLAQVALNIASNALRAMRGRGLLRLDAAVKEHDDGRLLAIELANDGPVIAPEDLERIFDPFCTRSEEGTGLGLAIAERIAEQHGGFIEARNTGARRGVSFAVVLPEAEPAAAGEPVAPVSERAPAVTPEPRGG